MLVLNADDRISTQKALTHPYVNMWYNRAEAEAAPTHFYDSEFENAEKTVEEWMGG